MSKDEEFKILDPRSHVRLRPGMYIGSTSYEEKEQFLLGKWKKVKYVPALLKMINEIFDNCLDEAIRTNFEFANIIDVSIDGNTVIISDNGRGIPQDDVKTPDGKILPRPAAAWTVTNAGTSFGDNRTTIGSHGLGSALVTYFSEHFQGKTWCNGNQITVDSKDGCNKKLRANPKIKKSEISKNDSGTIVKFTPDFSLLECDSIDETIEKLVLDRITAMSICFPKVAFKFNKKKVGSGNFKTYTKMYGENSLVFSPCYEFQMAIIGSEDGFKSKSYANGVNTISGGSYVDYISNEIADTLIPLIKRKHKINVNRAMIKMNLSLVLFANSLENPKFDSQTKEKLTNTNGEVKEHFNKYSKLDLSKVSKKILQTEELIEPIIQAELAKRLANEKRAATKAQNAMKKQKVAKHIKANKKGGMLFLAEGDSASGPFILVRDNNKHGCLPLRGVVMNTWKESITKILSNAEISDIIASSGLDINNPDSVDDMYYNDMCILVDADHDGLGHISPLLQAFFYKFWPRLLLEKRLHVVTSPILIAHQKGKDDIWAYDYTEAKQVKKDNPKAYFRYIKGLGSLEEKEYREIINNPRLNTIIVDNPDLFEAMFGDNSGLRKDIIMGK